MPSIEPVSYTHLDVYKRQSVTKMGKGGHVTTEVLAKICAAMDCGVDDIMEIVLDESEKIEKR